MGVRVRRALGTACISIELAIAIENNRAIVLFVGLAGVIGIEVVVGLVGVRVALCPGSWIISVVIGRRTVAVLDGARTFAAGLLYGGGSVRVIPFVLALARCHVGGDLGDLTTP